MLPSYEVVFRRDDKVENPHGDEGGKSHVEGEENQVYALVSQPSLKGIASVKVMAAYGVVMLLNKGDSGLRHGDAVI